MNLAALIFGFFLSITLLCFALSPTFVHSSNWLGKWWRKHIADLDPESTQEKDKKEGQDE